MVLSKITDKLYLSDYNTATDYKQLVDLGIKQILTVGNGMLHRTEELKTKYIYIDDKVDADIKKHFAEAFDFIGRDVTVVHCALGKSRSATIVIAYLMSGGMAIDAAYRYVKERRPIIDPNYGFVGQLIQYSKEIGLYDQKFLYVGNNADVSDFSNPWDQTDSNFKSS